MGHGARSAAAFVSLLQQARIDLLVDVRAYPVPRRHPQFSREPLSASLTAAGVVYQWQGAALGGMRNPADCHRSHIADWLVARGERVLHLIGHEKPREHAARLF